jgi:hypothetical protein
MFGQLPTPTPPPAEKPTGTAALATTMILRGAVGTLIGAAVAPRGREGAWGAAGFVAGSTLGEIGIVAVAAAALWMKAGAD